MPSGHVVSATRDKRNGRIKLVPANPTFPEITFKDGQTLVICGVVTATIKRFLT